MRRTGMVGAVVAVVCARAESGGSFRNEAMVRGIDYYVTQGGFGGVGQYGCGVALCDLDGDGDEDVVCCGASDDRIGVFENLGDGTFLDRTNATGIGKPAKASGLVAGDYDGDGDLDLFLSRWLKPAMLLRNDGGLHFTDVTIAAGIGVIIGAGTGCAFGDYDGDGWLDLAISNRYGTPGSSEKNRLLRNRGDGTFEDVTQALQVQNGFAAFQSSFVDVDGDGDLDLLVANDKGAAGLSWNRLYRNLGRNRFVDDVASGFAINVDAMGIGAGDLDGDGTPEIYVPNVPQGNVLLHSRDGGGSFVDVTRSAGVGAFATSWAPIFFDVDNDADLDLFVAANWPFENLLFASEGPWPMPNRAAEFGLADAGDSYCAAIGDIDGDGDEDLLLENRFEHIKLMVNHVADESGGRWIRFEPKGVAPNRFAVGMRIDVVIGGLAQRRDVACGSAYKSQSSLRPHFGLGLAAAADSITVRWPAPGPTRALHGYPANRTWPLWPPSALGDGNQDGVLDGDDRASLHAAIGTAFEPPSAIFDLDGDADVDAEDARLFDERLCDLDGDGAVGATDLAILLGAWGGVGVGDFDDDGVVGTTDLAILANVWSSGAPVP
ncbi:MAG: FG-GAP-like repeat-containing protein [Phycisphaerales bacterium]